jgi:threonine aldolase
MREIGGVLPEWDDLAAQVESARERGAAVHLDGARVWQCGPYYGRSLADLAGLFDTVYVSFYKDLLGIAGAALAGPADVVGEVRDWQARHGGLLYAQWPYAAAARVGLHRWLPRMPEFVAHARHLAELLGGRDDLVVTPDPPQVAMFHLALRVSPDDLRARALALADRTGLWTFAEGRPTDVPGWLRVEWSVTADTLKVGDDEVRRAFDELLGTA